MRGRFQRLRALVGRIVAVVYRRGIRPLLPTVRPAEWAGVPVSCDWRWGDDVVPAAWRPSRVADIPDYELALVEGLRQHVQPGDHVVIVGGGMGVTTTIAAIQAGPSGKVDCYEGSREAVARIRATLERNGVAGRVTVHHAVVGSSVDVWGAEPEGAVVRADELPSCDVLELDCEGAEMTILEGLAREPRVVLVETHGFLGAPTERISEILRGRGYRVSPPRLAEPRVSAYCEENDIYVLVAVMHAAEDG